jgi:RNA polymerase sigma-70 factor (ECF subfamily)
MAATATTDRDPLVLEEARLARAAAAGDGSAFAALYERYGQRAFNLAYRIAGSEADAAGAVQEAFLSVMRRLPRLADREPAIGPYLFTATHDACHDLMRRRPRTRQGNTTPEPAAPPAESQQEEIREASMRLPERQREALALRELEQLSYDEIAAIMDVSRNTVAQLISRARINLRDELSGTSLASVAAPSPECERALPLIAMRDDGQLEAASHDDIWLDAHLAGCERCGLGVEAMEGAGASYRAWAPIAAAPWLLRETMAKAAALAGADWGEEIAEAAAASTPAEPLPGAPPAYLAGRNRGKPPRRRATLAAGLAALLLIAGLAVALVRSNPSATPAGPSADTVPGSSGGAQRPAAAAASGKSQAGAARRRKQARTAAKGAVGETTTASAPTATQAPQAGGGSSPSRPASSPNRHPVKTGVQPTRQVSASKPKPAPAPAAASQPASAPTAEGSPPAEESSKGPHRKREPPGQSRERPPR